MFERQPLKSTGVEIHNGKIRITFTYRGKRCRDMLKGWVNTPANIKKAGNLRSLIVSEIQMGAFDYSRQFRCNISVSTAYHQPSE